MNPIDERLFDLYCAPILQNAENFDQIALEKAIDPFPLTGEQRVKLMDVFFDHHMQWSLDAFTVGLHLGLSLHRDVRREGPQQVQ